MITSEEIRRRAERQFARFLTYLLEVHSCGNSQESFFPLDIRADKGSAVSDDFFARKEAFEALWNASKAVRGNGYTVETAVRRTQRRGDQTVITRIFFETEADFLTCIGKKAQVGRFVKNVHVVYDCFAHVLFDWAFTHLDALCENTCEYWQDLCLCAQWFCDNPASNLYVREIPLPVHSKFIEENKVLITSLVDTLEAVDSPNVSIGFEQRFGLKTVQHGIRLRSLDPAVLFDVCGSTLAEMQLTAPDLNLLTPCLAHRFVHKAGGSDTGGKGCGQNEREDSGYPIFIVENLLVYLTFPYVRGGLCIFGGGFRAVQLASLDLLKSGRIWYFGDLDEHGFEILNDLRSVVPQVSSFCMEDQTLKTFSQFRVEGKQSRRQSLPFLTAEEQAVLTLLHTCPKKSRLEQERVLLSYVTKQLAVLGFTSNCDE